MVSFSLSLTGRILNQKTVPKAATTITATADAVSVQVYLIDGSKFQAMNEVYRGRFGPEPPVRTCVAVAGIPLEGCLVEIEVIAAL